MKVALIHNPSAGKGEFSADRLTSLLREHGYDAVTISAEGNLLEQIQAERADFTAIAGGDGTLRRASLQLINTGIVVAPLPLGTANNVGRSLGITGSPGEIIAGWSPNNTHSIDVGLARGPWGERTFLEGRWDRFGRPRHIDHRSH